MLYFYNALIKRLVIIFVASLKALATIGITLTSGMP
jgi:hypothetical protein